MHLYSENWMVVIYIKTSNLKSVGEMVMDTQFSSIRFGHTTKTAYLNFTENTQILRPVDENVKSRILVEGEFDNHKIMFRRAKHTNELVIDGNVYAEHKAVLEFAHTVSAVIDGECVYSEEVLWFPKLNEDPNYQYQEILTAFRTAASKMPRVDAIGVSSAGDYIDNEPRVASLFIKVPRDNWDKVKTIYTRAAAAIGDVPLVVANDGDVSALAGAMGLGKGNLMGIAMGTSLAAGYVDPEGHIMPWLNELAFVPVDYQEDGGVDEWSKDKGVGAMYFSQQAVARLAPRAGFEFGAMPYPEQLKKVQAAMAEGDERARKIYETIGVEFGYTIAYFADFYDVRNLLFLGRVATGDGGQLIIDKANEVLKGEFPQLNITLCVPDEKTKRHGQAVAAASLPKIG